MLVGLLGADGVIWRDRNLEGTAAALLGLR